MMVFFIVALHSERHPPFTFTRGKVNAFNLDLNAGYKTLERHNKNNNNNNNSF
jgi:hypothetical protein